ncbi:hypothetical protein VNO77_19028 [Canavalia gladiata]|uniref:Miraculin n=1 Tax=Canavalia gladiata TaxID=3824 RepID=A0AAN9QI61_CANGL
MTPLALLFLLLVAFTTRPARGAEPPEEVRDTSGKLVRKASNYFILPYSITCGTRCGIALLRAGNKTCPLELAEQDEAMQFRFVPANFKKGVIRVSTDLNVIHTFPTNCSSSVTVWKVGEVDAATGERFVTTGGVQGNPGPQTIHNWFKIEKFENGYKLVYCPTVCESCKVVCKDIGIYPDEDRNSRLALSDVPFEVKFQRARSRYGKANA